MTLKQDSGQDFVSLGLCNVGVGGGGGGSDCQLLQSCSHPTAEPKGQRGTAATLGTKVEGGGAVEPGLIPGGPLG